MTERTLTGTRPAERRQPSERRFWFIVLAGSLAALSYEILAVLQGDFSAAKKLLLLSLIHI